MWIRALTWGNALWRRGRFWLREGDRDRFVQQLECSRLDRGRNCYFLNSSSVEVYGLAGERGHVAEEISVPVNGEIVFCPLFRVFS